MVTIRISTPSSMLLANVLGVLGLVAIVAAVGGLAGVWWAVGVAGVLAVALSMIATAHAAAEAPSAAQDPVVGPPVSVRAVEDVHAA